MADAADLKSVFYLLVQIQPGVLRDIAQLGSASAPACRMSQVQILLSRYALVAQLEEALRLERSGYWFESSQGYGTSGDGARAACQAHILNIGECNSHPRYQMFDGV
jgi:hypothetical protein